MEHSKYENQNNETKSMEGVIFVFKNPNAEPKDIVKFCREFYGYKVYYNKYVFSI